MSEAAKFFEETKEPVGFSQSCEKIKAFVQKHEESGNPLALVTVRIVVNMSVKAIRLIWR